MSSSRASGEPSTSTVGVLLAEIEELKHLLQMKTDSEETLEIEFGLESTGLKCDGMTGVERYINIAIYSSLLSKMHYSPSYVILPFSPQNLFYRATQRTNPAVQILQELDSLLKQERCHNQLISGALLCATQQVIQLQEAHLHSSIVEQMLLNEIASLQPNQRLEDSLEEDPNRKEEVRAQLNCKIFVSCVKHPDVEENILRKHFSQFGKVVEVDFSIDYFTRKRCGFCFIRFDTQEAAEMASVLSDHVIEGKYFPVNFSGPGPRLGSSS